MTPSFSQKGYEIHRNVFPSHQITDWRNEADRVAQLAGTTCVRHLRQRSDCFYQLSLSPALLSLIPNGLRPVRSILFDKTSTENWPVMWHQDLTIAVAEQKTVAEYGPWSQKDGAPHVQPPTSLLERMVTIRIHLDDTPASNGALRVIPGSHLAGKLSPEALAKYDKNSAITCECRAGDVLAMSPLILHSSRRAETPHRRRILHFEYAVVEDLASGLSWFEDESRNKDRTKKPDR